MDRRKTRKDRWMDRRTDGGWMGRWREGRKDRWMDRGQMDG